jgi:polysaccharide biosynthesis protein PslH
MRVLIIDEEVPYPLNSGKRLRTFHLLAPLAARHEITFVCRRHEGSDSQSLDSFGIRTVVVNHPIRKKTGPIFYAALFHNLFSKYPYTVSSHRSPLLTDAIETLHREKPFDLVHCEWTPYAVNLGRLWQIPSVVDAHNVESMIWKRNYEIEEHPLRKAFFRLQWQKMLRYERLTLPRFSRAIAVSAPDRAVMSGWVEPGRIDIVDNGVDTEYFKPSGVRPTPHSMVFTGSLDWRPNVDAMLYFLESIWPIIRGSYPEATIAIVGRNPMDALREKSVGLPGVDLVGTVDDVRPYMARAEVVVVPLRVGGGSRLKILEAMAMEKAVVSSGVGAEGLEVADGENILMADSPTAFATAVGRLFEERELRQRLEAAGRKLAQRRYEWSSLSRKLEQVWAAASGHRGPVS